MAIIEIAKIKVRRGLEKITGIPNLDPGEFGWAQDTENLYIGKSLAEGADSNSPTRVLVEKDLENIFKKLASIDTTSTVNTLYTYRLPNEFLAYNTSTTLQVKLDSLNPSLYDFGTDSTSTTQDITLDLQRAINDLFRNQQLGTDWLGPEAEDLRRQLIIPAGKFEVTSVINLPPYASIIGMGPDKTKITFRNTATSMFRTIDMNGNNFESGDMQSGITRSREVYIGNMTLEFSTLTNSNNALISLDNVLNATVENCVLKSNINSVFENISTSTYTLKSASTVTFIVSNTETNYFVGQPLIVYKDQNNFLRGTVTGYVSTTGSLTLDSPSVTHQFGLITTSSWQIKLDEYFTSYGNAIHGTGIQTRGIGGGTDGEVNFCENIKIRNCVFDGLDKGIYGIGSVVRIQAEDNLFNNLDRGIEFKMIDEDSVTPAPTYARIINNRFQNIMREGIYAGPNAENKPTYHVSEGNYYVRVGNGPDLDDFVTAGTSATSVITFESNGNKSINDYFSRRKAADETTDPFFYYYPIVLENALVKDDSVTVKTINTNTVTPITKFYLTDKDQKVDINYQITGNGLSRKGTLLVNVAPDGFTSFSDYYNFSQTVQTIDKPFTVTTAISDLICVIEKTTATSFIESISTAGNWYIINIDNQDVGGVITSISTSITDYTITVEPTPTIDFTIPNVRYDFAYSDFSQPTFNVNTASIGTATNYATLEVISQSVFEMALEYRIDQQI